MRPDCESLGKRRITFLQDEAVCSELLVDFLGYFYYLIPELFERADTVSQIVISVGLAGFRLVEL